MFGLTEDSYKAHLKEWFGANWIHRLFPIIEAIRLPESHTAGECQESLRTAQLVVLDERARLQKRRKRKVVVEVPEPEIAPSQSTGWVSWLEMTSREKEEP